MISLLRMRTSSTMSSRMSSTMYRANCSSEMSSPSMSSLKSCPCRPPPLEKSTSKSNFTLLCAACSLPIDRLHPHNILRYSPNLVEVEFSVVRVSLRSVALYLTVKGMLPGKRGGKEEMADAVLSGSGLFYQGVSQGPGRSPREPPRGGWGHHHRGLPGLRGLRRGPHPRGTGQCSGGGGRHGRHSGGSRLGLQDHAAFYV